MAAIDVVLGDVIDDDAPAGLTNFVADRGLNLQFAAGLEAKVYLVEHRTGDPPTLGHPSDRGKTHARRVADDLQNRRHGFDTVDRRDVVEEVRG